MVRSLFAADDFIKDGWVVSMEKELKKPTSAKWSQVVPIIVGGEQAVEESNMHLLKVMLLNLKLVCDRGQYVNGLPDCIYQICRHVNVHARDTRGSSTRPVKDLVVFL